MVNSGESKCYFVQLQFDTFLDGELSQAQSDEFQSHVHKCQVCARELKYARTLHDFVLDMPQLDCDDRVLEPIHRLGGGGRITNPGRPAFWQGLQDLLTAVPMFVRYAVPVLLLAVMVLPIVSRVTSPAPEAPLIAESTTTTAPEYSPAEIQQALSDLNMAIQYLHSAGLRTEVMIGDRFIVTPIQESLDASFEVMRRVNDDPLQNDPI